MTHEESSAGVLVIVPALNEEATVAEVVRSARSELGCDVLVIDDGSTDATAWTARRAGAMVLTLPMNLGVGGAIRTGLRVAREQGRRQVVQLDADGQHDAREAKRLLEMVEHGGVDLCVGSRFGSDYEVSAARGSMMRLLSRWVSRKVGTEIDDTTSGFRAFGPRALELFSRNYPTEYLSDTVEALLIASDAGLRIAEIPVQMHQRQGGTPSSGRLRSAVRLARLWIVILMHPYRRPVLLPEVTDAP